MPGSWQSSFGSAPVKIAFPQYEYLEFATNTTLVWPTESLSGEPYVAALIELFPAVGGLALTMPDAMLSATGVVCYVSNIGATAVTFYDANANQIGIVEAGDIWQFALVDNASTSGVWRLYQIGATTSNAQAAALAGSGLEAFGTVLRSTIDTSYVTASGPLNNTHRTTAVVWQGTAPGTLTLDPISTLTSGWWCYVTNQGTDDLVIATSGGDTINGVATITLPAASGPQYYSCLIVASLTGFNTLQATPSPIPIAGGGTGADNALDALTNLGGTTVGVTIFTAPNLAAILAILGLSRDLNVVEVAATPYTVTDTDEYVVVRLSPGADATVNLPATPSTGRSVYVKDGNGDSAVHPITVVPDAGTIDDEANYVIQAPWGEAHFVYDGTEWSVAD